MKKLPTKESIEFNNLIKTLTSILNDQGFELELIQIPNSKFNYTLWNINSGLMHPHIMGIHLYRNKVGIGLQYYANPKSFNFESPTNHNMDFSIYFTFIGFTEDTYLKLENIGQLIVSDIKLNSKTGRI